MASPVNRPPKAFSRGRYIETSIGPMKFVVRVLGPLRMLLMNPSFSIRRYLFPRCFLRPLIAASMPPCSNRAVMVSIRLTSPSRPPSSSRRASRPRARASAVSPALATSKKTSEYFIIRSPWLCSRRRPRIAVMTSEIAASSCSALSRVSASTVPVSRWACLTASNAGFSRSSVRVSMVFLYAKTRRFTARALERSLPISLLSCSGLIPIMSARDSRLSAINSASDMSPNSASI